MHWLAYLYILKQICDERLPGQCGTDCVHAVYLSWLVTGPYVGLRRQETNTDDRKCPSITRRCVSGSVSLHMSQTSLQFSFFPPHSPHHLSCILRWPICAKRQSVSASPQDTLGKGTAQWVSYRQSSDQSDQWRWSALWALISPRGEMANPVKPLASWDRWARWASSPSMRWGLLISTLPYGDNRSTQSQL